MDEDQFIELSNQLDLLVTIVLGYRAKLLAGGIPDDYANDMTALFHAAIVARVFNG